MQNNKHAPRPAVATGEAWEAVAQAIKAHMDEIRGVKDMRVSLPVSLRNRILTAITPFLATPAAPADGEDTKRECLIDGVGRKTSYQPQTAWSDGEFDTWSDLGFPTASKIVASGRMAMFRSVNPKTKTRYLKISSKIEVCDLDEYARLADNTLRCAACCGTGEVMNDMGRNETCEKCDGSGGSNAPATTDTREGKS